MALSFFVYKTKKDYSFWVAFFQISNLEFQSLRFELETRGRDDRITIRYANCIIRFSQSHFACGSCSWKLIIEPRFSSFHYFKNKNDLLKWVSCFFGRSGDTWLEPAWKSALKPCAIRVFETFENGLILSKNINSIVKTAWKCAISVKAKSAKTQILRV